MRRLAGVYLASAMVASLLLATVSTGVAGTGSSGPGPVSAVSLLGSQFEGDVVGEITVREIDLNALRAELEAGLTSAQKEKMKKLLEAYAAESATLEQVEKNLRNVSIPIRTLSIGLTLASLYLAATGAKYGLASGGAMLSVRIGMGWDRSPALSSGS